MPLFIRSTRQPSKTSCEVRTVHALVVVAAEGLAVDEGERGDDEDDAGRCRSDARGQPSTAFVAAERVGGTVARAGVDITREREKKFRECPLLHLLEMEGASRSHSSQSSDFNSKVGDASPDRIGLRETLFGGVWANFKQRSRPKHARERSRGVGPLV